MQREKDIQKVNRCLVRIAKGEITALDELFCLTKKSLFVVARAYLYDKSKAEDVLSESYCKVVRSASSYQKGKNGYSWLYEIVKNTALNQNRQDRLRSYTPIEEEVSPSYEILDEIFDHILLEQAKAGLSESEKKLLFEYYFEGKTFQEIADEENRPKTTVYDELQRILSSIRERMDENKNDKNRGRLGDGSSKFNR